MGTRNTSVVGTSRNHQENISICCLIADDDSYVQSNYLAPFTAVSCWPYFFSFQLYILRSHTSLSSAPFKKAQFFLWKVFYCSQRKLSDSCQENSWVQGRGATTTKRTFPILQQRRTSPSGLVTDAIFYTVKDYEKSSSLKMKFLHQFFLVLQ